MYLIFQALAISLMTSPGLDSEEIREKETGAILIEDLGVARSYKAARTIYCDTYEWRIDWSSNLETDSIDGNIIVFIDAQGAVLNDAAEEVFARLSAVNAVSATCNPGANGTITRSHLLITGLAAETGNEALVQVSVDSDLRALWSFDETQ